MKAVSKIILGVVASIIMASCSNIGKLELMGYHIKSAVPESFHSVNGVVALQIANYGPTLTFTEIQGELYHKDNLIGILNVDDLQVQGNSSAWVDANGHLQIADNVSLLSVLNLATNFKAEEYSVSVSTKVKLGMLKVTKKLEKMPLSELLSK